MSLDTLEVPQARGAFTLRMKPREPRRKVLIRARMRLNGAFRDVRIRDISSKGLLLEGEFAPQRGTYLEVFRGRHLIIARVVWSQEKRFGVLAQDRMNVDAIVTEPDHSGVRATDASTGLPTERRSAPRLTSREISRRAARSRHVSAAFQFGFIVVLGLSGAVTLFGVVSQSLAAPMKVVSEKLKVG